VYQLSAEQYDVLYATKDYEREAHLLHHRLARLDPSLHTVLDVACGTGAHDEHLCRFYEVDGLDLTPAFLELARRPNSRGRYHLVDMRQFRLDRLYDTVLCLFSSIGYARTHADLLRTLSCFREHLTPRGVVVIEPWLAPDVWEAPLVRWDHGADADTSIVRMTRSTRREEGTDCISVMEFHYLMGTAQGIEHSRETHEMGLYTQRQMASALVESGFHNVHYDPKGLTGRGLYIARVGRGNS
jgi:SAM-dependent methyltransferase